MIKLISKNNLIIELCIHRNKANNIIERIKRKRSSKREVELGLKLKKSKFALSSANCKHRSNNSSPSQLFIKGNNVRAPLL